MVVPLHSSCDNRVIAHCLQSLVFSTAVLHLILSQLISLLAYILLNLLVGSRSIWSGRRIEPLQRYLMYKTYHDGIRKIKIPNLIQSSYALFRN